MFFPATHGDKIRLDPEFDDLEQAGNPQHDMSF